MGIIESPELQSVSGDRFVFRDGGVTNRRPLPWLTPRNVTIYKRENEGVIPAMLDIFRYPNEYAVSQPYTHRRTTEITNATK